MPHVSGKKLSEEMMERLLVQLTAVFNAAGNKKALPSLVDEFFTKTEKMMLAKRLAAILMLDREIPQHVITEKLSMSPSTIARLSLGIEIGKYKQILKIAGKDRETIFHILTKFVLDELPAPIGRGKWKRIPSMYKDSRTYL